MVDEAVERFGRIDILMNNAGISIKDGQKYGMLTCPKDAWDRVIATNVNGSFYVAQAVAQAMVAKKTKGVIVNTSSNTFRFIPKYLGAYPASKAAIAVFTKQFAKELAEYDIRVNAFGPGTTKTRMSEPTRLNPHMNEQFLNDIPMHRYGEVKEAVDAALFLASEESSFMLGEIVFEDGGQSL